MNRKKATTENCSEKGVLWNKGARKTVVASIFEEVWRQFPLATVMNIYFSEQLALDKNDFLIWTRIVKI